MSDSIQFDAEAAINALLERFAQPFSRFKLAIDGRHYAELGCDLYCHLKNADGQSSFLLDEPILMDNVPKSWELPPMSIRQFCTGSGAMARCVRTRLDELLERVQVEIRLPNKDELVSNLDRYTIDSAEVLSQVSQPLQVEVRPLMYVSWTRRHPTLGQVLPPADMKYMWDAASAPPRKGRVWT